VVLNFFLMRFLPARATINFAPPLLVVMAAEPRSHPLCLLVLTTCLASNRATDGDGSTVPHAWLAALPVFQRAAP